MNRRMASNKSALWLGLAASMLALPAAAATFVVNSTGDSRDGSPGDGVCADTAGLCTLRAAVMEANALAGADAIDLTGINDPNSPIVLTLKGVDESYVPSTGGFTAVATHDASIGDLNLTDSVSIVGAGSGKTIVQWAIADQADGSADRIFHAEAVATNVTVSISGLTVRNGLTSPVTNIQTNSDGKIWQFKRHGGCVALGAAAATNLFDPSITHGSGGGMGGTHGGGESGESSVAIDAVTMSDVTVVNCMSGADGGGIYNAAPLTLRSSIVSGNTATSNGGGVYGSAAMTIDRTTIGVIASNPALANPNRAENGGGIFDTGLHTTYITASALVGNYATGGGALSGRSTTIDNIENSTVAGNIARDTAGGITTNGRVNLKNVTIVGNQVVPTTTSESAVTGVAINSFGSGQFTYVNTLFANNVVVGATNQLSNCGRSGSATAGTFLTSLGHNLEDGDSCKLTAAGDLKLTNPQLQPLAANGGPTLTMALPMTSPAVDAGDPNACPNTDQRGQLRPEDGNLDGRFACDIGAFELFVPTADLRIDSIAAPDRAYATDPVTIAIVAANDQAARASASDVTIATGTLPSGFNVSTASVSGPGGAATCAVANGIVSCPVGTLAPGELATATIVGAGTIPGTLAISASVTASAPIDPNPANNAATVHVLLIGNADLSITGSGSDVSAGANTDLQFTVVNHGPDAGHNVRAAVYLPPELAFVSATAGAGSCTYSAADAAVNCGLGTLAAGASVSGTVTVTAALVSNSVTVQFAAASDERDQQPANDAASAAIAIAGWSDLSLDLHLGRTAVSVGETVSVALTVHHLSGTDTNAVQAVVTLPAGVTFDSAAS
ncbi:MAG: DUF11 domain-containing protein, partial [Proteobacteria bacterium]|nr:DUF11 domain-containing protein [Pseudomonadota bacterium]